MSNDLPCMRCGHALSNHSMSGGCNCLPCGCDRTGRHDKNITINEEEISRLTADNAELCALNERWVRAATNNYPFGWAMDPGNPELTCANIREAPQAMADGYKAALEKTTADNAALRAEVERLKGALQRIVERCDTTKPGVPPHLLDQIELARSALALTPPDQQQEHKP